MKFKQRRENLNLSRQQLASMVGVTRNTVLYAEHDAASLDNMYKILYKLEELEDATQER
jgi:DNA-binding XRE family transcriptional regulator